LIKPAAFQAGGGARMKLHIIGTANRRISNKKFRMMQGGIAALSLFSKIKMKGYLTSIFVIPCSIFDIYPPLEDSLFQSFFFDLTGHYFGRRLG
jgi:hypothetical protein